MPVCLCGCGEELKQGKFKPGHDNKLRKSLEEAAGGLPLLAKLVEAARLYGEGKMSSEDFGRIAKMIFQK